MARRDGGEIGFAAVFAHTPQLSAGALAGLGSALWLNVVAPFAGLVAAWGALILVNVLAVALVAVLAMLLTTAGTLLAADWRAEVARRQAWAEIDCATVELCLPPAMVPLSKIDPGYLTATDSEALRSLFRAHRFTSPVLVPEADISATSATPVGGPMPSLAGSEAAPTIARKIAAAAMCELAIAHPTYRNAGDAPLGRGRGVAGSGSARPEAAAEPALGATRLVANGGLCADWFVCDRPVPTRPPPNGQIIDFVVLSGDRGDRDRRDFANPSICDGIVKSDVRQGFWNGSRPPLGDKMVEAERRRALPWTKNYGRERLAEAGLTPGTLRLKAAAAYIGVNPRVFKREVDARRLPQPLPLETKHKLWAIKTLDDFLAGGNTDASGRQSDTEATGYDPVMAAIIKCRPTR